MRTDLIKDFFGFNDSELDKFMNGLTNIVDKIVDNVDDFDEDAKSYFKSLKESYVDGKLVNKTEKEYVDGKCVKDENFSAEDELKKLNESDKKKKAVEIDRGHDVAPSTKEKWDEYKNRVHKCNSSEKKNPIQFVNFENKAKKCNCESLKEENKSLSHSNVLLKKENDVMEKKISVLNEQIKDMQHYIDDLIDAKKELLAECESLKNIINNVKKCF